MDKQELLDIRTSIEAEIRTAQFIALARRCEEGQAGFPLNRDIEIALGRARRCDDGTRHKDGYVMPLHRDDYLLPPRYTDSVNAAISLVPGGWRVRMDIMEDGRGGAWVWLPGSNVPDWAGLRASPALALCAAALRAHAEMADV